MNRLRTVTAVLMMLVSHAAFAQFGGPSEKTKQCTNMIYPQGNYNPCDPTQCAKVCQCGGGRDCMKSCERESKTLFGPNSCRANIPADKLTKR